ncbi:GAF and ANTAR domain-containing protein [soil metagenome]
MSTTRAELAIAELSTALTSDFDLAVLLTALAEHTRVGLDAYSAVVMLVENGDTSDRAGVHIVAEALGEGVVADLDFHTTGPGLISATSGVVTMIDDLQQADETRWPDYRRVALAAGMRAVRAFPIVSLGVSLGSLVVHTDEPWGSTRPQTYGQIMANLAAVALASSVRGQRRVDTTNTIQTLLEGRVVIATATGILAELLALDISEARLALNRLAHAHGCSVTAHAQAVVDGYNQAPARADTTAVWARPPDMLPPSNFDD